MENWKKIAEHEAYEVSDLGRVRRGEKVLKGSKAGKGYLQVAFGAKRKLIHRLVGEAFLPNPDGKPTINHIDHNTSNNRLDNLEWATYSEQAFHSPAPIGSSGERQIYAHKMGWIVLIWRKRVSVFSKCCATISEAVTARDEFLASLTQEVS